MQSLKGKKTIIQQKYTNSQLIAYLNTLRTLPLFNCFNVSVCFDLEDFGAFMLIERFSFDLEMKAREQNRNDKRTEIERFDWFIERTDKRVWLFIG